MNRPDYRESAVRYDNEVKAYGSYGHEVIFGMGYEYVRSEDKLLDIGIGTGLASIHFAAAGLRVYGVDNSMEMLSACRSKSFTEELIQCDISREKLPFGNESFNHVICCGVLHFMGDLTSLFSEVRRVLKSGGIFAFTIAPMETGIDFADEPTPWGVSIYKHTPGYIMKLMEKNKIELLKEQRLLIKGSDKVIYDMLFSAIVGRCR